MKMLDELRRRDQLLAWMEQGLLTPHQLEQALAPQRPQPSAREWQHALDRLLALYGSLLLALGAIFFFAFNWDDLHRFGKLALALGALTGFAGMALWLQPGSVLYRAVLLGAALATGGVLALVGQTYQTGADIWQLFTAWAVLMLPWVLLSRSAACWGLFWAIANLALLRYFAMHDSWLGAALASPRALLGVAAGNLLLLLVFELFAGRLLSQPGRSMSRLAGFALLSALALGACIAWWESTYLNLLWGLGVVWLIGIPLYRWGRRDLLLLALLLYSLVGVLTAGLARLFDSIDGFTLFNLLGLFMLLSSALASVWLHRVYREGEA
ncbi:DUF2157 domain-containing protein [Pseudomonas sp. MYb185]|uniref:DUF2157 domain-containing protein n=1 Tax=Pseudomonas sp. MYb185 TaxID=1848729 RepID=UPI000CFB1D9F|nr:DUF2157 domain-containing protein [Pseudomonas sp. MYb185]PRB81919.1 hypothetical protein CQ007_06960 [Pseudomonas sp. MYb185]